MRGWSKISLIYMNRLQNFGLRLFFWALINRDVSCSARLRVDGIGLMLVLSQLSSAIPLCLSCCPSSPAAEVSVVYSLLSFGFLPCSSSVYLYFQMSLLLAHHLSHLHPWLTDDSCICPMLQEGRVSQTSSRGGKVGRDIVVWDSFGCKDKHLGAVEAVSF